MPVPVFDLHCDLLSHLARDPSHTPEDPESNASLPQLKEGGVKFQALPIFTVTNADSVRLGVAQHESLKKLLSERVVLWRKGMPLDPEKMTAQLYVMPAIENLSGFFGEDEDIRRGFSRLDSLLSDFGNPLYVGLTWNGENKFAGGVGSSKGLTPEGREVVEYLRARGIPIDLSHASDSTCEDLLAYQPELKLISSHSNARVFHPIPRNIPDHFLREVIRRNGIMGVNVCKSLHARDDLGVWIQNMEHLCKMGAQDVLCFGIDFFASGKDEGCPFLTGCENASKLQVLIAELRKAFPEEMVEKIAYKNAGNYLSKI